MIFVVEDDANIGQMECYALKSSGFETRLFERGEEFWQAIEEITPELILLDLMLPGQENGLTILEKLRSGGKTRSIPVIIVTALGTELDKVRGLDSGADDYLTKPFGILELISRVRAVLRRAAPQEEETEYAHNGICLYDQRREVLVDGVRCELTYKEYELLKLLLKNKGIVLSRDQIMDLIWDGHLGLESRTVDVHIKSLRQKLGTRGEEIKTVRNVGYRVG